MAGYKDGKYWREEQDHDMMVMFTTDNNSKEWLKAYRRTIPRLKKMAESILRTYFHLPNENRAQDIMADAITHLLLKGVYNPDKPKMYAYCGTAIRHYYHTELLVTQQYRNYDTVVDKNYDINESDWLADEHSIDPDFQYMTTERLEQLQYILKIIDDGIVELSDKPKKKSVKRELKFLEISREYFVENFTASTVSNMGLAGYIDSRLVLPVNVLTGLQSKYFNKSSHPDLMDKRKSKDWIAVRKNSYLMDDYCPNDNMKSKRRKIAKEYSDYRYF